MWLQRGGNDFFVALAAGTSPNVLIGNGVLNTVTAIQRLWASGARHILVMNVADLGVTPAAQSIGFGPLLTQLSAAYDQVLDAALDQLTQAGVSTIRLDAFAVLDEMAYTPADYGFSNVTMPLIMAGSVPNPDEFLFWDAKHPTTDAHKVLAQEALQQLISTFSPSNGQAMPDASANALHGLVNASQHKN
jgi:phospholipase/lecithinase/hemolysin